jgi:ribosomal protein L11 methyltransferase
LADPPRSARRHPALDLVEPAGRAWPAGFSETLALAIDDLGVLAVDDGAPGRWRIFFESSEARGAARAALGTSLAGSVVIWPVDVEDEGWTTRVQEDLRAVRVGRLLVAPPWDLPSAPAGTPSETLVVVIEPSMGFGTGHHQSTRLCLRLLQVTEVAGRRVVDVGTGSGVLAIAARRLGARDVVAFDVDPDAVASARANVALNGLDGIEVVDADVAAVGIAAAEVVLANLTMFLLRQQRAAVAGLVAPGGALIGSGFTVDQVGLVLEAFPGFDVEERIEEDDWVGLVLRSGVRS